LARHKEALINFHEEEITVKEGSDQYNITYNKKNIKVSCDTTIETLKVAVLQHLNIPIFQQMLWFGEVLLSDSKSTLKEYGILPGSTILAIKVPEAEAFAALDRESEQIDALYRKTPEQGFEGTSLTGGPIPPPSTAEKGAEKGSESKDVDMITEPGPTPMETVPTTPTPTTPRDPEPDSSGGWACGMCTFVNHGTAYCEMCETPRNTL